MQDLVLKHVPILSRYSDKKGTNIGFVVDVETTGLNNDDEIFELSILPFTFDDDLNLCEVKPAITKYREPKKEISIETLEVTGIDPDTLIGQSIDNNKIRALLSKGEVIVSHNVKFDRYFVEKDIIGKEDLLWGVHSQ